MTEAEMKTIAPFLDEDGMITRLPQKQSKLLIILSYLAEKFEPGRDYTEKEINSICDIWHTFGDYFVLRRGLIDHSFLCREPDGARYWRPRATQDTPNE